ncbi:hypothetical protein Y032_0028g1756 [Ancylostoma ceylanicum]|uniref:Uncharacterized protein n=2 Tax=Ancylostoma ceylanicum TaxID=53326 RepID=A0A016UTU8_9BILA|nr:hypothetical protein Y032_0028g1756 [Ancylostoma ceylanicum]
MRKADKKPHFAVVRHNRNISVCKARSLEAGSEWLFLYTWIDTDGLTICYKNVLIANNNIIFHATFVFSVKLAFLLNFPPYTYRISTKIGLRYKMDTIFVLSTSNNPPIQSFNEKKFLKILEPLMWNNARRTMEIKRVAVLLNCPYNSWPTSSGMFVSLWSWRNLLIILFRKKFLVWPDDWYSGIYFRICLFCLKWVLVAYRVRRGPRNYAAITSEISIGSNQLGEAGVQHSRSALGANSSSLRRLGLQSTQMTCRSGNRD